MMYVGWPFVYAPLFWLLKAGFWLCLVVAVALCLRAMIGDGASDDGSREETPLEVLKMRYAKGEISKKQFDEMKKDIA